MFNFREVRSLDVALPPAAHNCPHLSATIRNRPQPSALVRNRLQPLAVKAIYMAVPLVIAA